MPKMAYQCGLSYGADNGIRTRDLVLTKDALCLLSYISIFNCKVATFIMLISQNFGH